MIKKIRYVLIPMFVVILLIIPLFIRVHTECASQLGSCPDEVNSNLKKTSSKYLFQAEGDISKILKKDYLVLSFSTQFKLPNTLLVNIIVKKPVYALKTTTSSMTELIDQNGTVLEISDVDNLPTVLVDEQPLKPGLSVEGKDLFALKLISGMYQMYQVGYGSISNDSLVVDMPTGVRVTFPLEGDYNVLLGGLRLIYTKVTTNYLGIYKEIDMRYKNPVLRR